MYSGQTGLSSHVVDSREHHLVVLVSRSRNFRSRHPVLWFTKIRMDSSTRTELQGQEQETFTSSPSPTWPNSSAAESVDDDTIPSVRNETTPKLGNTDNAEEEEDLVKVFQEVLQRKDHAFENRDKMTLELLQYNKDHMVGDEQQTGRRLLKQFLASRFLWIDADKNKTISPGSLVDSDEECQRVVDICIDRLEKSRNAFSLESLCNIQKSVEAEIDILYSIQTVTLLESILDTCLSIPKLKPHFLSLAESRCIHDVSRFSDYVLGIDIFSQDSKQDLLALNEFITCHRSVLGKYLFSLCDGLQLLSYSVLLLLSEYPESSSESGFICDQPVHNFLRLFELYSFKDTTSDKIEVEVLDLLIELSRKDEKTCRNSVAYKNYVIGLKRMRSAYGLKYDRPFLSAVKTIAWNINECDVDVLLIDLCKIRVLYDHWHYSVSNFCQERLTEFGISSWVSATGHTLPADLNKRLNLAASTYEFRNTRLILLIIHAVEALKTQQYLSYPFAQDVLSNFLRDLKFFMMVRSSLRLEVFDNNKQMATEWMSVFKEARGYHCCQIEKISLILEIVKTSRVATVRHYTSEVSRNRWRQHLFSLLSSLSVMY